MTTVKKIPRVSYEQFKCIHIRSRKSCINCMYTPFVGPIACGALMSVSQKAYTPDSLDTFPLGSHECTKLALLWDSKRSCETKFLNSSNFSYMSFFYVNFENLTIEFHVPYILHAYPILFKMNVIYYSINKLIFYIQF